MADSASLSWPAVPRVAERAAAARDTVPWYIWSCMLAILCGAIGGTWDISWHESIGRDSFWTPAHMLLYLYGVIAGVSCGYLIVATTFHPVGDQTQSSVRIWGFRGPLGAFLCVWGAIAMIASAPFDDWWHNAYGLDIKILSPPHVLLILGSIAIRFGILFLILSLMNRVADKLRDKLHTVLLFAFPALFGLALGAVQELTLRIYMHSAMFYLVICLVIPLWLAAISRVSDQRWACAKALAIYTGMRLAFLWILPLFPAEPKLGPVYQRVTHLIPPDFPLLLIVPAVAFDLLRPHFQNLNRWVAAAAGGVLFLATFLAVQWPFADFLMAPASRNRIFGTHYFPYFVPSTIDWVRNVFATVEPGAGEFWKRMAIALGAAILTTRAGLSWGDWMRRIRR